MKHWKLQKLSHKVVYFCTIFAVVLSVCVGFVSYTQYEVNLIMRYQVYADTMLNIALSSMDGQAIATCIESGVENDGYYEARDLLCTLREKSTISHIYSIYFPEENPDQMAYVMNGFTAEELEAYGETAVISRLGEPCAEGAFSPDMQRAFWDILYSDTASNYMLSYIVNDTPEYGYQLTAFVPVKDADGQPVCILATDVSMDDIKTNLTEYAWTVASTCTVLLIVFLVLAIFICNQRLVTPILRLANSAKQFVEQTKQLESPESLRFEKVEIKSNDEVKILADSVSTMTDELRVYMQNLQAVTAEKERIDAELNVANAIQASMLPCIFPAFSDRAEFEIDARMQPAKEVGGDFYDFFMVDETHLAIVAADVSGKGIPGALFMVIAKTLIKDHTLPGCDLGTVFSEVNRMLCESNSEDLFVTAFEGVLNLETGEFQYVNAGHEMPFISHRGAPFAAQPINPGFVLAGLDTICYHAETMQLEPGDKIFIYTDGIPEAINAQQELYGMERLAQVLAQNTQQTPSELLRTVRGDVDRFVGSAHQFDDITMLCLQYKGKKQA